MTIGSALSVNMNFGSPGGALAHSLPLPSGGPHLVIETAADAGMAAAVVSLRREVFEREWNTRVPDLPSSGMAVTFVAVPAGLSRPVAALTVLETTGHDELHGQFALTYPNGARVARYTQLAVLKPYRGLGLPFSLIAESRRRFVVPEGFHYTWLLYDAHRAERSTICHKLVFEVSGKVFNTDHGLCRVLSRTERVWIPNSL